MNGRPTSGDSGAGTDGGRSGGGDASPAGLVDAAASRRIRAIVTDVDGCMTDGTIFYGDGFSESKAFNVKDGLGITLAGRAGISTFVVTGRNCHAVARRARELGFTGCFQGYEGKLAAYEEIKRRHDLEDCEIACLGDDLLDLCILTRCGLSFAPADAVDEVKRRVTRVLAAEGGRGALREMVEAILKARGDWDGLVQACIEGAGPAAGQCPGAGRDGGNGA